MTNFGRVVGCLTLMTACSCAGSTSGENGGTGGDGGSEGSGGAGGNAGGSDLSAGSGGASAANTVNYKSADGVEQSFTAHAVGLVQNSQLHVVLYSGDAGACGQQTVRVGEPWLELYVIHSNPAHTTIVPGAYQFMLVSEDGGTGYVHSEAYLRVYETCGNSQTKIKNEGDSGGGTLTIAAISATEVSGSFDFNGVTGSFQGPVCTDYVANICAP